MTSFSITPACSILFSFLDWPSSFLNNINGLYQTRRELLESLEVWQVVKSVTLSVVITIVGIYILKVEGFPASFSFRDS